MDTLTFINERSQFTNSNFGRNINSDRYYILTELIIIKKKNSQQLLGSYIRWENELTT